MDHSSAMPPRFRFRSEAPLADAARQVRAAVEDAGAVVVEDVPVDDDDLLVSLVQALGRPSALANGGLIHEVMPRHADERQDISSTEAEFPLHTDSTFLVEPHDHVVLACAEATAGGGGESLVLHVAAAIAAMRRRGDGALVAELEAEVFPFPMRDPSHGTGLRFAPILGRRNGSHTVRYRADALRAGLHVGRIEPSKRAALDAFEAALRDMAARGTTLLAPGDVLVVDNHRVLHGRAAIAPGAPRRLRRMRLFAG